MMIVTELTALQSEVAESNGRVQNPSFEELLDLFDYQIPQRGDYLTGEVLQIEANAVILDVGAKRDAVVPAQEVGRLQNDDVLAGLSVGDEVPVYVLRTPEGGEELLVSLERGMEQEDWRRAELLVQGEEAVEVEVIGQNKGGLLVAFGRLSGFVPNSHLPELRSSLGDRNAMDRQKAQMHGDRLHVRLLEVDRPKGRLLFSPKFAAAERRQAQLEALEVGQVLTGRVANLVTYGAFVDLGAVTGLLHISKIAWGKVENPAEHLAEGQEIEVLVDSIDLERERIGLNRQALLPNPWQEFAAEHQEGDLIEGEVTAVVDFGAFIRLTDTIEGLIHVSEMPRMPESAPDAYLATGDRVLTRIVTLEPERERVGLSLNKVTSEEEIAWLAERRDG